ncbi:MAG TPA: GntR family transcriptional regulator [Planctomycetota bacterium]
MKTLAPAPRNTLAQDVLDRLRRAILGGELPAGAPLPEAATAAKLGVSRVPVREALVQLERQGLVVFDVTGRGAVRRFTPEDVQELLSLRAALQGLAARRAAEKATPADIARLKGLVARTAETLDLSELSALDTAFHDEIVVIARHGRLTRAWGDLRAQMELWLARLQRKREDLKHDVRDATFRAHGEFLAILTRRNPEQAARCMEGHCFSWSKEPIYLSEDA